MSLKGQTDEINLEWIIGLGVVLIIAFALFDGSGTGTTVARTQPHVNNPPPRVSRAPSLSSAESYSVSFSCTAYRTAAGGGLRLVPREVLWLCRRCNEGDQDACSRVQAYMQNADNP